MIRADKEIRVYIFRTDDGRSSQERLALAVKDYEVAMGLRACKNSESQEKCVEQLAIVRTERGKPYFRNCPDLNFSISHSGVYWVCALYDEPLGIDIQEHTRLKGETIEGAVIRFRKMAHRFFHPVEARYVELDAYHNFFEIWTAKESYVKYTGQGIDDNFSEICVIPTDKIEWQRSGADADNFDVSTWTAQGAYFWECTYPENYTLCACSKKSLTKCALRVKIVLMG